MWELRRDHEIEHLRRSVAMLPAGASALDREAALALLARLRDLTVRLRHVEADLRAVLDELDNDPPDGSDVRP